MNPNNHANNLIGDWNRSLQGTLPQCSPHTTKLPIIMLPIQKYNSTRYGMKTVKAELKRSISNGQSRHIADRMAVLWLVVVSLGIMILSFGKPPVN
jgi:hypothetical protein